MSDYDFKSLNDKEFEILCVDLLSKVEGKRLERFKAGRDSGVDGRYFSSSGKEVVLQCKHWANTPIKQLIQELGKTEKPKLDRLKPKKYLLTISNPLSRNDKKAISSSLAPHILSESDIYGNEDLNDLIRKHSDIERRNYKLWLQSASVLQHIVNNAIFGRSRFSLEEIVRYSAKYVVTANHEAALNKLENLGVVIITGEPGVGKTTLADHLCLHYVAENYSYLKIADDIREAESAFDADAKQVIYFDDFLGRNYLEALKGHEGGHITQFIKRVIASKNKRFILTSRSTILNQGKLLIDSFEHNNVKRNEFELRIQSLTELDKAQILYNHIWHSGLGNDYIDELYVEKRYRKVIAHKNFNPRLISYITDSARLDACPASNYWSYIEESLANPAQVWENPFIAQLDDFTRAIVLLVVLHGAEVEENIIGNAYHEYLGLKECQNLQGRREFQANIRLLTGSFLNRIVNDSGFITLDLFNPSIGDFVLGRYKNDSPALLIGFKCIKTVRSLITLVSMHADHDLSKKQTKATCDGLLGHLVENKFRGISVEYASYLFNVYRICGALQVKPSKHLEAVVIFLCQEGIGQATDYSFDAISWGFKKGILTTEQAIIFLTSNIESSYSASEIKAMSRLLSSIQEDASIEPEVVRTAKEHVVEVLSDSLTEFIDVDIAFSNVDYDDIDAAYQELKGLVESELDTLGVDYGENDVVAILDSYDIADGLREYFEGSYDGGDDRRIEGPQRLPFDQIDDLFDRGK